MSVAKIKTVAFNGIDCVPIELQVHIGPGLPFFGIVGLPDKSIAEAKERIRATFNTIGLSLPAKRITVNMSPASMQKEGSHYDLPIAIGLLVALQIIPQDSVDDAIIMGELTLDGSVKKVPGVLMAAMHAQPNSLICPLESCKEAKLAGPVNILGVSKITELISYFKGEHVMPMLSELGQDDIDNGEYDLDMNQVEGQNVAKRALEIAAIGNFHVLMVGPPGVGKSMLAKRFVTILPDLSAQEAIEVAMIYSISNKLQEKVIFKKRPFREPHHSASLAALVGGGSKALPGEISLAHNGVLFLDELAHYSKALDGLREAMETGEITIARAQNHITYPAKCQIIAAMNPCKCGYFGTPKACSKAPICASEYQNKISGPIMDRFDMKIYMDTFNPNIFKKETSSKQETSAEIKARVLKAIYFQASNFKQNLKMLSIEKMQLSKPALDFLINFCSKNQKSQRSFDKIARIARCIASMEEKIEIEINHVAEASMYNRE